MAAKQGEGRAQTYPVLLAQEGRVAKRVELVLRLAHERVESSLHVWQLLSDVVHEDLQGGGKMPSVSVVFSIDVRQAAKLKGGLTWLSCLAM